jgi:uridine kinase
MGAHVETRADLLARLADLIVAVERPHPVRVAIDGRSAAGKTTLADELVAPIERHGRTVIRASVDDFHRPAAERYRRGRYSAESFYFDAFDYPAVREHLLLPLGPGGDRRYRPAFYDAFNDHPIDEPPREAPDDAVVVVDGIFLLRPELSDLWDIRVFVDVPPEESVRRGVLRDQGWMGSEEEARRRYLERYLPGEQVYLTAVRPQQYADAVVDNRDPAHPGLRLRGGPDRCRP